jgi:hypothetical protein
MKRASFVLLGYCFLLVIDNIQKHFYGVSYNPEFLLLISFVVVWGAFHNGK